MPWLFLAFLALLGQIAACNPAGLGPTSGSMSGPTIAAPADMSVSVIVDRARYAAGDRVLVTIENGLDVSVFAPPRGPCSIVSLSRLEGGQWRNVDACPSSNVYVTEIAAQGQLSGALGPASQPAATGPIVIGPVSPYGSGDDLTTLPTVAPWRSGDPVRVVPEGAIAPPFSAASANLAPGTYRVEFSFSRGTTSGPVATAYSEPFIVVD